MEIRDYYRDRGEYGYLSGNYKREVRFNEINRTADSKYREVLSNDRPDIELIYKGRREYKIPSINYDESWFATATIYLDPTNRKFGSGIYQYTKKADSIKVDFGTYEIFVDEIDEKTLYVFHQNKLPSGLSAGYEIWVKQ